MINLHDSRKKYNSHKSSAKSRNIPFELTFDEWLKIWVDSGHYEQRGLAIDEYCMARKLDKGGYTIGNVRIRTTKQNRQEYSHVYKSAINLTVDQIVVEGNYHKLTPEEMLDSEEVFTPRF